MAVDDGKSSSDDSRPTNWDVGDSENSMKNVEAGDSVTQYNEIHQHYNEGSGETVIPDPDGESEWIEFCEILSQLPYFEAVLVPWGLRSGGLGLTVSAVWMLVHWSINGVSFRLLESPAPFLLLFISAVIIAIPLMYRETDKDSQCPECEQRFALRPIETRIVDTMETDEGKVIFGEREIECRSCGYATTENPNWRTDELSRG